MKYKHKKDEKYRLSFTTGGLFHPESVTLAMRFKITQDWKAVRDQTLLENLLQARTHNSAKRVCSEVISRLKTLTADELDLLICGTPREQESLLWIGVCRRYRLIADFAVEVLRERYISLRDDLSPADFDAFFNRKAEWHPELEKIRPGTRQKLRQVLFKMMREAGLLAILAGEYRIRAPALTPKLLSALPRERPEDLGFFPVFADELKRGGS